MRPVPLVLALGGELMIAKDRCGGAHEVMLLANLEGQR
jgi:hypothetical protein